jgi:hypothetical protein
MKKLMEAAQVQQMKELEASFERIVEARGCRIIFLKALIFFNLNLYSQK